MTREEAYIGGQKLKTYIFIDISRSKPSRANILILWFYWYISLENLSEKANISIFLFFRYISLKNLSEQIYQFFDFTDISRSDTTDISRFKTFPSEYIDFMILLIYLAWKPFQANILIFWFYWYILLKNLSERIYWFFDFTDISCLITFPSEYINLLILITYLIQKPFWANISIFWF